jgi:pimeloyl-ACP methyl ester carboxylesterase
MGRIIIVVAILFIISFTMCGYLSINKRDDVQEKRTGATNAVSAEYNSSVIKGSFAGGGMHAVMIAACPVSDANAAPGDYIILDRPGTFMIYVPAGRYHIYAFSDYDDNGIFEDGEVAGVYRHGAFDGPAEVEVGEGDVKTGVDITADPQRSGNARFPRSMQVRDDAAFHYQAANGDVVKIYDERFCSANAERGWWSPSLFMKAFGANIYFTQKYDPAKIPVLFIHGAQGSPQNWAYFMFRLDKNRYQPWFFYYPSGIRLSLASRLLFESLLDLRKKYGFKTVCITAHSMGGLITRDLLTRYDLKQNGIDVKIYMTLASPWTGFDSANMAFMFPSKKLPIWYDVTSTSSFINQALRAQLPPTISYYLFYGKEDSVARGTALDERAYGGAKEKFGFDVDHDSILSDRRVFVKFREVLIRETSR